MKKQTLLGAAALTTLALAGAAHAGELSPAAVGAANVTQYRVIATEAAAASLEGTVGLHLTPSDNAILPTGNAILKISLDGGATFGEAVTSAAIVGNPGFCAPTVTPSTGGGKNDSSVTFLVSNLQGCKGDDGAGAEPLAMILPIKLNGTSAVNISTELKTEGGTAIDGGTASTFIPANGSTPAKNLVSFAPAFALKVTPAAANPAAKLSDFKALTTGALGTSEIKVNTTSAWTGIGTGSALVAATDVTAVKYTVKGDFETVVISTAGAGVAATLPASGILNATGPGQVTYTAAPIAAPDTVPIVASTYTVAAEVTLKSAFTPQPVYTAQSLSSIVREGSSYMVPWVASGTLSAASTSNTVIRIANTGAKTGPVSMELLTSSAGVAPSTKLISVAPSIAKGGEVVLTSAQIQTLVGADFGRGDIRLTVEAQPSNLIVRRFVQSTVNGALSEVSLGRSNMATGSNSEPVN